MEGGHIKRNRDENRETLTFLIRSAGVVGHAPQPSVLINYKSLDVVECIIDVLVGAQPQGRRACAAEEPL